MITREEFEQYIGLKEKIEAYALEVYGIYCQLKWPDGKWDISDWEVSCMEQGYKSDEWFVIFRDYRADDVDDLPLDYLFEPNPKARIIADIEEERRLIAEKKEAEKKEHEAHMEKLERESLVRLIEKYGIPE